MIYKGSVIMGATAIPSTTDFKGNFKIGNTEFGHYLKTYKVTRSMQVTGAETTVNGTTVYTKLGYKYKVEVTFLPMSSTEMLALVNAIDGFDVSITFLNPFGTAANLLKIIPAYISDMSPELMYYQGTDGADRYLYKEMSMTFIGKKCYPNG